MFWRPIPTPSSFAFWPLVFVVGCTAPVLVVGCTAPSPTRSSVGTQGASVLLEERDAYFEYRFVPARSYTAVGEANPGESAEQVSQLWQRELGELALPSQASGAVFGVALDSPGGDPLLAPGRPEIPIRYSCGVTMISPSIALTAAHCVAEDTETPLTIEMYRPTLELEDSYLESTVLSGGWPFFTHPTLDEQDGYLVDRYTCGIMVRCSPTWGPVINCPVASQAHDVALLECEGNPGAKYGYLDIMAQVPPAGTEVTMNWSHEVYDRDNETSPTEFEERYIFRTEQPQDHFHYFGANQNQLLPLRSIPWPDGTPRRLGSLGWTDMMGCHGTSGSSYLAMSSAANQWEIWGIATSGGSGLGDYLCQDSVQLALEGEGPGSLLLGSNWTTLDALVQHVAAERASDCRTGFATPERNDEVLDGIGADYQVSSLFTQLDCQPLVATHDGVVSSAPFRLDPYRSQGFELAAGQSLQVGNFSVRAGDQMRLGVQVALPQPCSSDCGTLEVETTALGAPLSLSLSDVLTDDTEATVAFATVVESTGEVPIEFTSSADGAVLGGVTWIREGQANTFDTPHDRLEAALYSIVEDSSWGPAPMRFVGDGIVGFSALLMAGERMLLTRQAVPAGLGFTVRLAASSFGGLECGWVNASGEVLTRVPCASVFSLPAADGAPAAFFVELSASASSQVIIDAVSLASEAAQDDDGDFVADVLDDCPEIANPFQQGCPGAGDAGARIDAGGGGGQGNLPESNDAGAHVDAGPVPPVEAGVLDASTPGSVGEDGGDTAIADSGANDPMGAAGVGGSDAGGAPGGVGSGPGGSGTAGTSGAAGSFEPGPPGPEPAGSSGSGGVGGAAPGDQDPAPAGSQMADAGSNPDVTSADGCGCRVVGGPSSRNVPLAFLSLGWLALAYWRRRGGTPPPLVVQLKLAAWRKRG